MIHRYIRILLVLAFAAVFLPAKAEDSPNVKEILAICSQPEFGEWTQQMVLPLDELSSERKDIHVTKHFMEMVSIEDVAQLEQKIKMILDGCESAPDLCVLMGGSTFEIAKDLNARWEGIPIILAGETTYYCQKDYVIGGKANPEALRTPVSDLLKQGINLTLIHTPFMVEQTVDMMLTVQPEIEKFIFIAGENFQSNEGQIRLEAYLSKKYPSLEYQLIRSSETTDDELIETLRAQQYPRTGILYGSWVAKHDYGEKINARMNFIHILEVLGPIFTMKKYDLNKAKDLIGYVSYDHDLYRNTLKERAVAVLDDGTRPDSMHFFYLETGTAVLNWQGMELYQMDTSLIPEDAIVVGGPSSFWKKYKKQLLWLALFVLLGIGAVGFLIMRRSIRALEKANRVLEKGNEAKAAFAQSISHEIRTPLNSIMGFAQLLGLPDGQNTEEEKAEYLEYVMNNSKLLTTIINDMLSMADLDGGYFKVNLAPVNLNDIVRMAIKSTELKKPESVELVKEPGVPEGLMILTDGIRVQQILINLLNNAFKYTEKGRVTIGNSTMENLGQITFYVEDTGPGIPEDKSEEIFGRFVKLNKDKPGVGLGLCLCRMIADSLGGKVWLDTTYTGGARFVFTIPWKEQ